VSATSSTQAHQTGFLVLGIASFAPLGLCPESAFASLIQQGVGALIVTNDPLFSSRRDQIVERAAQNRIPSIYYLRRFTEAGGLLSYGASLMEATRQVGICAGRILSGAKPADLRVWRPTKFELVIISRPQRRSDFLPRPFPAPRLQVSFGQ
jgi:ABC-type sugar transport system substrate-binding protein